MAMRILWFTNTSSLYKNFSKHYYHGGGWIESLERIISQSDAVELAISFFHQTDEARHVQDKVTYYPIRKPKKNSVGRFFQNWSGKITEDSHIEKFKSVIADFKPDLIQVFGTEGPFAAIQAVTNVPVVIHIQGLVNPYLNAYYPPGIDYCDILFSRHFLAGHLLGNSDLFLRRRFKEMAKREMNYLREVKYIIGRTHWDRTVTRLMAPSSRYFHGDEVLRPLFYTLGPWTSKSDKKIKIVTTISSTPFKGIDMVLKTAAILKTYTGLTFEWQVVGVHKNNQFVRFFEDRTGIRSDHCQVKFVGVKSAAELAALLLEANVFAHPSYIDNSPNSVCEAQMVGLPVIACNTGGVPSLLEDGISGVLVPANAPFEMASGIARIATDAVFSDKLSRNGRAQAMTRHSTGKILDELLHTYRTIIYG
jgi:glycosyltransferase involved in cell wall biosynthesis